jgi:hypothetical protein
MAFDDNRDNAFSHANGQGGEPASDIRGGNHVKRVEIVSYHNYSGMGNNYIVSVTFFYSNGTRIHHGPHRNHFGFPKHGYHFDLFEVPPNDCIVTAVVSHNWGTYGIRFVTRNGIRFPNDGWYGHGHTKTQTVFEAKPLEELCGMTSRSGGLMDKIEFYFGKPVYVKKVDLELRLLVYIQKGVGFKAYEEYKIVSGTKTSSDITTNEVKEHANKVSAKVSAKYNSIVVSGEASFEGNHQSSTYKNLFTSVLNCTDSVVESTKRYFYDGTKGCYVCHGKVVMYLSNKENITFYGDTLVALKKPPKDFKCKFSMK